MGKTKGTDATKSPVAEGGWSHGLRAVPGAVIATSTLPDLVQPAGVFDDTGAYVHEAVLWRGRALMVPPETCPEPVETIPGRWLWAGVLLNHFGHFLVESTGRLWGIDALQGHLDGVIFMSKRDAEEEGEAVVLSAFHQRFIGLLGIDLPFRVVTQPTRVELLEVPGQGFGIGNLSPGTPAFRAFMQSRFAKDIKAEGAEKLYISRSGLSAARGGVLEEEQIEQLLSEHGFDIFHPQKAPIEEQIARYKAARQVVALDGSALHLMAMVAGPDQDIAVIKRRDSGASDSILAHLTAFAGRRPHVIDVISQDWVRSDRKRADRTSVGELDFAKLSKELADLGFLPAGATLPSLTPKQAERAMVKVERELKKRKLTFRPVPRGVDPASVPIKVLPTREEQRAAKLARREQAETAPRNARQAARLAQKKDGSEL
ncbi:glycosyltransferase family 61 protein [Rhodobacter sp. KR11]|uniref:glycosyltransferase family 61 protein n=1 Tax=Rhodobacter sp. KR11 TaxID=2974588 RepID=UPI00222309CC|nr:glycosyltransferase family 61 protein [Rhodobacter sp. KR11]MCW1919482.1 glycosyltransferase family 61 protein [Rhodobacter sp. KR11]